MISLTPERPYSEENPYHLAIYLHSLIKAAVYVVKDLPPPFAASTGIDGLMTIIEERADALSSVLDAPVFSDLWPRLQSELGHSNGRLTF